MNVFGDNNFNFWNDTTVPVRYTLTHTNTIVSCCYCELYEYILYTVYTGSVTHQYIYLIDIHWEIIAYPYLNIRYTSMS